MKCKRLRRLLKRLKMGDSITVDDYDITRIDEHAFIVVHGPDLLEYNLEELVSVVGCE